LTRAKKKKGKNDKKFLSSGIRAADKSKRSFQEKGIDSVLVRKKPF